MGACIDRGEGESDAASEEAASDDEGTAFGAAVAVADSITGDASIAHEIDAADAAAPDAAASLLATATEASPEIDAADAAAPEIDAAASLLATATEASHAASKAGARGRVLSFEFLAQPADPKMKY